MAADPFSMVYTELWDLANNNLALTSLVKLKNQIRYDSDTNRDPEKRQVITADLPSLALVSDGLTGNLHQTSSSSMILRNYSWYITTGDMRITELLLPVEWELFRAMSQWQPILSLLEFGGQRFVKRMNLTTITNGVLRPENRTEGPIGWLAIWSIEVEMHFPTAALKPS